MMFDYDVLTNALQGCGFIEQDLITPEYVARAGRWAAEQKDMDTVEKMCREYHDRVRRVKIEAYHSTPPVSLVSVTVCGFPMTKAEAMDREREEKAKQKAAEYVNGKPNDVPANPF